MIIDIIGLRILKIQYGRYDIVATFRTVACVMPQVFHGTRGLVTVAESSALLLRSRDSYPFLS